MTTSIHRLKWYERHENLVALGHYLVTEKSFNAEGLLHFFEKPWNYEEEWNEMDDASD